MNLSVIIPTLNEAEWLPTTLDSLGQRVARSIAEPSIEVIVADCGSSDETLHLAQQAGARTVAAPRDRGRAGALAAGAQVAGGDILLFLDADTLLPNRFDRLICLALEDPTVVGGAFNMRFRESAPGLRTVERINRLRYRLSKLFYGDQGVFVRNSALGRIGGVPQHLLMESALLCRRLKPLGRLVLVEQAVETSARRFLVDGVWPVFRHDLRLWLEFNLRLPIDRHAETYWGPRERRPR